MWFGHDNWRTREGVVGYPLYMPGITRRQLRLREAFLDGKTRGVTTAAYFERARQGPEPSKQHISGELVIAVGHSRAKRTRSDVPRVGHSLSLVGIMREMANVYRECRTGKTAPELGCS